MKYVVGFFSLFALYFGNNCNAQNLIEAVQDYSQREHIYHDPELIEKSKIKSIEKLIYAQLNGALDSGVVVEKSDFRSDGWPERMESKQTYRSASNTTDFHYDSLGRLIRKTTYKPLDRETEIIIWQYQGDAVTKKLYFLTPRGMDPNNETLSLFSCDSFQYDTSKQSVLVRSNFKEDCPNPGKAYFGRSFDYPQEITLDFYLNNRVKNRSVHSSTYSGHQKMDSCGYRTTELTTLFSNIVEAPTCLPKDFNWLYNTSIDSVRYKGDSITIHLKRTSFTETYLTVFDHLDSSNHIRLFPNEKRFEVQTITQGFHIFQAGNNHHHMKEIKHYNFDMKLVRIERMISSYWDGDRPWINNSVIIGDEDQQVQSKPISPIQFRTEQELYDYYENGMIKSVTSLNNEGIVQQKTVYKMTYFQ